MRLPCYEQLPTVGGHRVSWGVWDDDDRLGCLNLVTPERAARAAGLVRRGEAFSLDAGLHEPDPPLFGRPALAHRVSEWPGGRALDDEVTLNTQSSSQWDGLAHIREPSGGHYNRRSRTDLGMDGWPPVVTRGVLADVARWRRDQGRPLRPDARDAVTAAELEATLAAQDVEVEPGDVLLVHTGWLDAHRRRRADRASTAGHGEHREHEDDPDDQGAGNAVDDADDADEVDEGGGTPGLEHGEEMARLLWDRHVAAVAADNPALEANPAGDPSLHVLLIPHLGIPIGELWDLGRLAADCADDGCYELMITSAPLRVRSGIASPPNAVGVK